MKNVDTSNLQLSLYSISAFDNLNSSQEMGIQIGQRKSEFFSQENGTRSEWTQNPEVPF